MFDLAMFLCKTMTKLTSSYCILPEFWEYCYFDHKEKGSELLEKKVNDITVKVDNLEKKLGHDNQQVSTSDFETLEKKLERIERLIEEKNRTIEVLEEKIKVIEVKHVEKSKISH